MTDGELHKAQLWLIKGDEETATISLPPGMRLLVFVQGKEPSLAPVNEPGVYEFTISDLSEEGSVFPMALVVIERRHVATWLKLDEEEVDKIIDYASHLDALSRETETPKRVLN